MRFSGFPPFVIWFASNFYVAGRLVNLSRHLRRRSSKVGKFSLFQVLSHRAAAALALRSGVYSNHTLSAALPKPRGLDSNSTRSPSPAAPGLGWIPHWTVCCPFYYFSGIFAVLELRRRGSLRFGHSLGGESVSVTTALGIKGWLPHLLPRY